MKQAEWVYICTISLVNDVCMFIRATWKGRFYLKWKTEGEESHILISVIECLFKLSRKKISLLINRENLQVFFVLLLFFTCLIHSFFFSSTKDSWFKIDEKYNDDQSIAQERTMGLSNVERSNRALFDLRDKDEKANARKSQRQRQREREKKWEEDITH